MEMAQAHNPEFGRLRKLIFQNLRLDGGGQRLWLVMDGPSGADYQGSLLKKVATSHGRFQDPYRLKVYAWLKVYSNPQDVCRSFLLRGRATPGAPTPILALSLPASPHQATILTPRRPC
jgi:hypothetical protein